LFVTVTFIGLHPVCGEAINEGLGTEIISMVPGYVYSFTHEFEVVTVKRGFLNPDRENL